MSREATSPQDVQTAPREILDVTRHRPWPLPAKPWTLRMRWTDLLFAHWPVDPPEISPLLPGGLEVDTFAGAAWIGVVPFRMERVQLRGLPAMPGTALFAEANVRTYVIDRKSGQRGVYFFSLDASNPVAVLAARGWYHLPYFFARMQIDGAKHGSDGWLHYRSRRLFTRLRADLSVRYRKAPGRSAARSPEEANRARFLTERYALFTGFRGGVARADVHHLPWPLEPAEAVFEDLSIARAPSIRLPEVAPVLHYSGQLDVYAWRPQAVL